MSSKWAGYIVNVDCGVLGVFEGEVSKVDSINQTISLKNVTRNSIMSNFAEVVLRSKDIKSLKILQSVDSKPSQVSFVGQNNVSAFARPRSTKKEQVYEPLMPDENKRKNETKKKLFGKRGDNLKWQNKRDEACFSEPVNTNSFDTDFDFEKNLALFDKQAVFEEIDALSKCTNTIRLVDCNKKPQQTYRHDENIILSDSPVIRKIQVPCETVMEYVTDCGMLVPSVTKGFRKVLFEAAKVHGLSEEIRLEMTGRAATDMVLQLLGGNHRLNPRNSHQKPTVVVICDYHNQGVQGLKCARHLANHHVNVTVLLPGKTNDHTDFFIQESKLLAITPGIQFTYVLNELPLSVDIIVSSFASPDDVLTGDVWSAKVSHWANECKAPILGLDPVPESCTLNYKWILWPALPYVASETDCSIYICDVGIPEGVFTRVNSLYFSPFGSKFIIPLYSKRN